MKQNEVKHMKCAPEHFVRTFKEQGKQEFMKEYHCKGDLKTQDNTSCHHRSASLHAVFRQKLKTRLDLFGLNLQDTVLAKQAN